MDSNNNDGLAEISKITASLSLNCSEENCEETNNKDTQIHSSEEDVAQEALGVDRIVDDGKQEELNSSRSTEADSIKSTRIGGNTKTSASNPNLDNVQRSLPTSTSRSEPSVADTQNITNIEGSLFSSGDSSLPEPRRKSNKKTRFAGEVQVIYMAEDEGSSAFERGTEPLAEEIDQQQRSYRYRYKTHIEPVLHPKSWTISLD